MVQLSESDLLAVSHHLFYEIWMFYESARFLKQDGRHDVVLTNVHLESCTVHGRVLLAFFYNEAQKDDIIAEHYIKRWRGLCPDMRENLKKLSYRVGKEIVHLTYFRIKVTSQTKKWDVYAVERELYEVIKKFQECVPKHVVTEKLLNLCPIDTKATPVPTTSATPFYATNTSAWVYKA